MTRTRCALPRLDENPGYATGARVWEEEMNADRRSIANGRRTSAAYVR